jgi:hypothetical protein
MTDLEQIIADRANAVTTRIAMLTQEIEEAKGLVQEPGGFTIFDTASPTWQSGFWYFHGSTVTHEGKNWWYAASEGSISGDELDKTKFAELRADGKIQWAA